MIFLDDHEPAHVHVFGDGHAKVQLLDADGRPRLIWVEGMKRGEVRRAMGLVNEQQRALLARWRDIHG